MSTQTTALLQKNNRIGRWFLCFCFLLLSIFPVYRNFYYSNGMLTYERHKAVIEKKSEFYNPWQYRILCPYTVEALVKLYSITVDKIYPVEQKIHFSIESNTGTTNETNQFVKLMQTRGAMKYMVVFIFFRFTEHFFIFFLAWRLWGYFVKSEWLIFLGINFLALAIGNSVAVADLSFNTYMDIIFYLTTANIIVYKKNHLWLLPITVLASFNRETGILIPALYFISQTEFLQFKPNQTFWKSFIFPPTKIWWLTIFLYVLFFAVFIGLRVYFGYKPQQVFKVPAGVAMLKLNLFSVIAVKGYMELLGTFAVIPLIILYTFKRLPYLLKKWFLFIVPIWFPIHFVAVVAYQTRTFLVPLAMIMIPMFLWLIENEIKNNIEKPTNI